MAKQGLVRRLRAQSKVFNVLAEVFDWYPASYSAEERTLLRKLDLSILVFASLSFFAKFLDQSNITNAYVSGLKEELHLEGNDLNYLNVAYYSAYVVGQVPFIMLQSRPRLAPYLLPTLEIIWAVLTFSQSSVTKFSHLVVLRAMVGFFEAPSFAGTHFILGSWYRHEELWKRAGTWFLGNSLGSMFSGYLQAAAYKNLNGVAGRAGWQWLFIIDGVITLPLAFLGFAIFPGLPSSPKRWFLTHEEYALASTRMPKDHRQAGRLDFAVVKRTLGGLRWWLLVAIYILLIQSTYWTGYMTLWLKSEAPKYSIPQINVYPTFVNLIAAIASWLGTSLSGIISPWKIITFASTWSVFATTVLTIWNVPTALKFIAFYAGGLGNGCISPVLYSWANLIMRDDPEARALTMGSMMTFGYTSYATIPLATFPVVEAPRFPKGYPASIAFNVALWALFLFTMWRYRTRMQSYSIHADAAEESESTRTSSLNSEKFADDRDLEQTPVTVANAVGKTPASQNLAL